MLVMFAVSGIAFAVDKVEEKSMATNTAAKNNTSTNTANNPEVMPGVLSIEEENKLSPVHSDEKTGTTYTFGLSLLNKLTHDQEKKKYKNSKKLQYKINCSLFELKSRAKARDRILKGDVRMYIRDDKGDVVFSKEIPLKTFHKDGCFIGELEKAGVYYIVVWIKHENILFGKKSRFGMAAK